MADQAPEIRSSLEIMGCHGLSATLSRPPSGMPDFQFVRDDNTPLSLEAQIVEESSQGKQDGVKALVQFVISVSLLAFSLLSITATGTVMTVLNQIGKPIPVGYTIWMVVGIAVLVFSVAGLGHVLYGSPKVLTMARLPRRPQVFRWNLRWPSLRWPAIRFPIFRRQSAAHSPNHLPDPQEFELDNLGNRPRPPTPYPGPSRPVPAHLAQSSLQDSRYQTLPLGFPVPPSGRVNRISNAVSRISKISFQSAPRSVSPLSDMAPTPPPKEPSVSRFQSREPLLQPATSGEPVAQSEARASILTELCDAVQLSNPEDEQSPAAQHYSPLATTSSPGTATTARYSAPASMESPKPTIPIKLASHSRGTEHED